MVHTILNFLFLIIILSSAKASFDIDPKGLTCEEIARQLNSLNTQISINRDSFPNVLTVEHISWQKGPHGGRLERVKKVGESWGSTYKVNSFDPQGDPRWFIYMLGDKASSFFGLKVMNNDKFMTVPDATELNNSFQLLNEVLVDVRSDLVIKDLFYEQKKQSMDTYLVKNSQSMALPLAENYPSRSHDIAYHLVSIFLPNPVKENSMKLTRAVLEFVDHVLEEYASSELEEQAKLWATMVKNIRTQQIDAGTGSTILYMNNFLSENKEKYLAYPILELFGYRFDQAFDENSMEKIFRSWTNQASLTNIIQTSLGINKSTLYFTPNEMGKKLKNIQGFTEDEKFYTIWENWQDQYTREHPTFDTNYLPSLEELCQHMAQKRHVIKEVAEKLVDAAYLKKKKTSREVVQSSESKPIIVKDEPTYVATNRTLDELKMSTYLEGELNPENLHEQTILDIGSGAEALVIEELRNDPGNSIDAHGVDISLTQEAVKKPYLQKTDIRNERLGYPDGHFDKIFSSYSLFFYDESEESLIAALTEMDRLLKKNGHIHLGGVIDQEKIRRLLKGFPHLHIDQDPYPISKDEYSFGVKKVTVSIRKVKIKK